MSLLGGQGLTILCLFLSIFDIKVIASLQMSQLKDNHIVLSHLCSPSTLTFFEGTIALVCEEERHTLLNCKEEKFPFWDKMKCFIFERERDTAFWRNRGSG